MKKLATFAVFIHLLIPGKYIANMLRDQVQLLAQ